VFIVAGSPYRYALRGGRPAAPPPADRSPRGGIIRKKAQSAGRAIDGVQFASVVVYPRANFRAARDVVRCAQLLGLTVTPVGNPVYGNGRFVIDRDETGATVRVGPAGETRSVMRPTHKLPAYHDAYRVDGPDGATGRVCAHPGVRRWVYLTNVGTPYVSPGQGAFTPGSEKRHREHVRAAIDAAHDRRVERAKLADGWGPDWLPNPVCPVAGAYAAPAPGADATWADAAHAARTPKHDSLCPPPA
jgi:hypothetical protein